MKLVTKAGQKYTAYDGSILTVKSFAGESGIEYDTLDEAQKNNPRDKPLIVLNVERGGGRTASTAILI